jgi:hypothetical protein
MIGNTDFSTAYSHNGKLLVTVPQNKFIPLPYDFDMSGIVDPSYAVTNESLGLKNIRDRQYRGFKRDESLMFDMRDEFVANKAAFFAVINSFKNDFDNPKSHQEVVDYITSFFEIIEDDKQFKLQVLDEMRTK